MTKQSSSGTWRHPATERKRSQLTQFSERCVCFFFLSSSVTRLSIKRFYFDTTFQVLRNTFSIVLKTDAIRATPHSVVVAPPTVFSDNISRHFFNEIRLFYFSCRCIYLKKKILRLCCVWLNVKCTSIFFLSVLLMWWKHWFVLLLASPMELMAFNSI